MRSYIIIPFCLAAVLTGCAAFNGGNDLQQTVTVQNSLTETKETESETTTTAATPETVISGEAASSETTEETTATEETTEETTVTAELPFEDTPENAYARLSLSFQSENGAVYPDDYGGVYSYGGTLFVAITEYTPPEYYTSLLSDYTCVRYKTVANSLNRLTEIAKKTAELLDPDFGVYEYFADVPSNKAAVSITEGDPKKAQNYLRTVADLGFTLSDVEISMAEIPAEDTQGE